VDTLDAAKHSRVGDVTFQGVIYDIKVICMMLNDYGERDPEICMYAGLPTLMKLLVISKSQ
jgi:hypothetical protein